MPEIQFVPNAFSCYPEFVNVRGNRIREQHLNTSQRVLQHKAVKNRNNIIQVRKAFEPTVRRLLLHVQNIRISAFIGVYCLIALVVPFVIKQWQLKQNSKLKLFLKRVEFEKELLLLQGQETEKMRISSELHDNLGNSLAGILLRLRAENESGTKNDLIEEIERLNLEVRTITHSMSTAFIQDTNFYLLLSTYVSNLTKLHRCNIHLDYSPFNQLSSVAQQLSGEARQHIFRIIQELLHNCIKHAFATMILLGLVADEKELMLMVEDNGVGFNPENKPLSGIGLKNVAMRVKLLQGEMHIDSSENNGTVVSVTLPINRK